jgi:hypothetical protein
MIETPLNQTELVEYYMGHTNRSDMKKNYLHLGSLGNKYIEENGKKIIDVIDNYFKGLFTEKKGRLEGKEEMLYSYNLQKPIIKEVIYYDISHQKGTKRLIWTIPNPEDIEDRTDYDEDDLKAEKSIVEQFNERNSPVLDFENNKFSWDRFSGHDEIDHV